MKEYANRGLAWIWSKVGHVFSDEVYLKVRFRLLMGKKLNLKVPQTFSEKLQWLKLYNRRPEYTKMVDKYAVKEYVLGIIGEKFVIPTLGVWDNPEEIEWEKLPNQFVLKTTHGGGSNGVVICRDKTTFDKVAAISVLKKNMKCSDWRIQMEWPYKDVPHRIIAEKYIEPSTEEGDLKDYKFFCYNGKMEFFKIDFDRRSDHHANYYDREGKLLPFGEKDYPPKPEKEITLPSNLFQMIVLAEKIAKGSIFERIDLYNVNGHIYFGEITLYPAGGLGKYVPDKWDYKIGQLLDLKPVWGG